MKEQITDTDRLDFIIANDAVVQTDIEPYCRCGSCYAWCVKVNGEKYFSPLDTLRSAIDEAMEKHK